MRGGNKMPIIIKQGEDYRKYLHLQYADTLESVDLSEYYAKSELRNKPGGTLKATAECSITPEKGDITVKYSSAQTASIEAGEYGFDVWLIGADEYHPIYSTTCVIAKSYTELQGE